MSPQTAHDVSVPEKSAELAPLPEDLKEPGLLRSALRHGWQGNAQAFFALAAQRIAGDLRSRECSIYGHDEAQRALVLHAAHPMEASAGTIPLDSAPAHPAVRAWLHAGGGPVIESGREAWEASVAIPSPGEEGSGALGVLRLGGRVGEPPVLDVNAIQTAAQALGWCLAHLRHVEQQQRQLLAVSTANRELEAIVYTAAHDLTEPIRTITEFSGFLQEDAREKLGSEGMDDVRRIHQGGLRLKRMLDDLLRISRSGHALAGPGPVDTHAVMADVTDALGALIRERHANVAAAVLPAVNADRTSVFEILANLVANAIKFNHSPTPRVEVGALPEGAMVEFYVRDNGIGIPPEHHRRIFDLFFQLDEAKGAPQPGTGAGLTIAKRLVQRYGGRIWVESAPGRGSTFRFTLPAAR